MDLNPCCIICGEPISQADHNADGLCQSHRDLEAAREEAEVAGDATEANS